MREHNALRIRLVTEGPIEFAAFFRDVNRAARASRGARGLAADAGGGPQGQASITAAGAGPLGYTGCPMDTVRGKNDRRGNEGFSNKPVTLTLQPILEPKF